MSPTSPDRPEPSPAPTRPSLPERLAHWLKALPGWLQSVYTVLGLWLTLGLLLSAGAMWGFGELAEGVMEGATRSFDRAVLEWLTARGPDWVGIVATELTALGAAPVLTLVAAVASAFLWTEGRRRSVALLWIALVGSLVLTSALKTGFGRQRPSVIEAAVQVHTLSFPSGHATQSMVVYTVVAYLVARQGASRSVRWITWGLAAVLILLIGVTRMYLGVHYPSDVLAGFAVGFVWAMVCVVAVYVQRDVRHELRGRD